MHMPFPHFIYSSYFSFRSRLPKIKEYVDKNDPGATIIPFSGAFEQTLVDLPDEEARKAHCEENKCQR